MKSAQLDRKIPPKSHEIDSIDIVEAELHYLDNQVPLHIINSGTQPLLKVEWIIKAGKRHEKLPGQAYMTAKMLKEGTKTKSANEIAKEIDQYGAHLDINLGLDFLEIELYTLSKYLKKLAPLLQEILFNATFPKRELDILKTIKSQKLKIDFEKNGIWASKKMREAIFGAEHPYGSILKEEDINNIKQDEIITYFKEKILGQFEIVIAGQVSDDDIAIINQYFGQHKVEKSNLADFQKTNSLKKKLLVDRNSLQSSIRIGKQLVNKQYKDFCKIKVVNEILGGYFGSRLMKNIREDKGYTYGIQSVILPLEQSTYFVIGTDVKREFTQNTLDEVEKEILKLQNEPISQLELKTVKNYMVGKLMSTFTSPFSLAEVFKRIHLFNLSYQYYYDYFDTIKAIDANIIQEVANSYFNMDSFTEVVVGGYH